MRLLDLFCGRWGWSRAFAARGWECVGVDLVSSPLPADNARFYSLDILEIDDLKRFEPDFIVASSPCEQFSVHGMKHFHPEPKYPELGIRLFNHTRALCEASGVPYIMENVRAAQQFVGKAAHRCGPFYLWGSGVPLLMPQGVKKNQRGSGSLITKEVLALPLAERRKKRNELNAAFPTDKKECARRIAVIPPELANCVADYAERILEQRCAMK